MVVLLSAQSGFMKAGIDCVADPVVGGVTVRI
jgi:hypothetical protein